jgi:hypothetical protein
LNVENLESVAIVGIVVGIAIVGVVVGVVVGIAIVVVVVVVGIGIAIVGVVVGIVVGIGIAIVGIVGVVGVALLASHKDLWCYMFAHAQTVAFSNFLRDMAAATLNLTNPSYCNRMCMQCNIHIQLKFSIRMHARSSN